MKLQSNLVKKHTEDWNCMKLEFEKQTENIDKLSEQYSQFYQEYNKKLHRLNTEYKQKLEEEIQHLVEVSEENRQCCICLCKLSCDDAKPLRCGHEFHENCINEWLRRGKTACPECRTDCSLAEQCKFKNFMLPDMLQKYIVGAIFTPVHGKVHGKEGLKK